MRWNLRFDVVLALAALAGCLSPSDDRPGLRLRGETVEALPADWSFTDQFPEIELEVDAPVFRHSVTIWCSAMEGVLYVGGRAPETKRWTRLVGRDPNVRLRIGGRIYDVALVPVEDPDVGERVRLAYTRKYKLPAPTLSSSPVSMRYWRVMPRPD